eukprot:383952-Karenia_brevis.AAC.1
MSSSGSLLSKRFPSQSAHGPLYMLSRTTCWLTRLFLCCSQPEMADHLELQPSGGVWDQEILFS